VSEAGPPDAEGASREAVREAARAHDFDRYLAALLAPPAARADLIVIAAFAGELARIPHVVREPMMGEIRLQWWRDAIAGFATGAATGHPVADALGELARRWGLPREELIVAVDAREADLYADPFADEAALDRYLAGCEGTFFALAATVLGASGGPQTKLRVRDAGRAFGLMRLLVGLPHHLARGRVPLPMPWLLEAGLPASASLPADRPLQVRAVLARAVARARADLSSARQLLGGVPRAEITAFLPLALVEPQLQAFERRQHDLPREIADIAPLRRVWRLWWAHRRGRI
jgi:phytoene synthase